MADVNSVSDTQVLLQSMLQRLRLQPSAHTHDAVAYSPPGREKNGGTAASPHQTPPTYNFELCKDGVSDLSGASGSSGDIGTSVDNGRTTKMPRKHKYSLTKMKNAPSEQSVTHSSRSESNIPVQRVGEKRWTQKVKDKWKERHKNTQQGAGEKEEPNQVADNFTSPIPVLFIPDEHNTISACSKDDRVRLQPIASRSPVEAFPSPLDNMSETLFSPGTFNLMEEIFTGQEWAKFLPSSTSRQSGSIVPEQEMGLTSSINVNVRTQWNHTDDSGHALPTTPSRASSESGSFHNMDTTEHTINQGRTPDLHNGQHGRSDSGINQTERLDLTGSRVENNHSNNDYIHVYPHRQHRNANPSFFNDPSVNPAQAPESNRDPPGSVHEVLPVLDLSYLQPKDASSCLMKQTSASRKRVYSVERTDSNERRRSDTGGMHQWRHNSTDSEPPEGLSPASSSSSLQCSISQDSESSLSIETVIKKRRVEKTRHVRFADTVTIVPMLPLPSDDEDDIDDEEYPQDAGNGDGEEEEEKSPSSRASIPRWIETLRSRTNRTPKLKIPRIRSRKYRFV